MPLATATAMRLASIITLAIHILLSASSWNTALGSFIGMAIGAAMAEAVGMCYRAACRRRNRREEPARELEAANNDDEDEVEHPEPEAHEELELESRAVPEALRRRMRDRAERQQENIKAAKVEEERKLICDENDQVKAQLGEASRALDTAEGSTVPSATHTQLAGAESKIKRVRHGARIGKDSAENKQELRQQPEDVHAPSGLDSGAGVDVAIGGAAADADSGPDDDAFGAPAPAASKLPAKPADEAAAAQPLPASSAESIDFPGRG